MPERGSYAFIGVPTRITSEPNPRAALPTALPESAVKNVFSLRKRVAAAFANTDEAIRGSDGHRYVQNPVAFDSLKSHIDAYTKQVLSLAAAVPEFRHHYFYYWSSSVGPIISRAFGDLHYDLAAIHSNLGGLMMTASQLAADSARDDLSLEGAEKVAYGWLSEAAGHFALSAKLAADVDTMSGDRTTQNALLPDMEPAYSEFMSTVALSQAQEIGTTKAAHKPKEHHEKHPDMVPRLCSRMVDLTVKALEIAKRSVQCPTDAYKQILLELDIKTTLFSALSHANHGSMLYSKDGSEPEGMWHIEESQRLMETARKVMATKSPEVKPEVIQKVLGGCLAAVDGAVAVHVHKVQQLNRLVSRVKSAEGPFPLPKPMELARPKSVALPEGIQPMDFAKLSASGGEAAEDVDGFVLVDE